MQSDEDKPVVETDEPLALEQEEEVSIVYLDENDTVLSDSHEITEKKQDKFTYLKQMEISDSEDSTLDSMDLKESYKGDKLEEKIKYESENVVEKLEEQVQSIKIEETFNQPEKTEPQDVEMKVCEKNSSSKSHSEQESEQAQPMDVENIIKPNVSPSQILEESNDAIEIDAITEKFDNKSELNEDGSLRRSSRIKTISTQNRRSVGHGLVKDKDKFLKKPSDDSGEPMKVKSRWRRLSEIEQGMHEDDNFAEKKPVKTKEEIEEELRQERECEERLRHFITIKENEYKCDRNISREAKKMLCDCFLTHEEYERGELGCGEDCLNRLLMIECGQKCNVGDRCTNKRFQKMEYSKCKVFRTEKKGFGIQAAVDIPAGDFIMEYVGEVLDSEQFEKRANDYSNDKNRHYYFMALRSDAVIDATTRGNISRFINHSCDPNAETQKWTVNGELRIGFFSTRHIDAGEELTFDYQFQRYGKEAQKCYCEAATCRGWIGQAPGEESEGSEVSESEESEVEAEPEKSEKTVEEQACIDAQKAEEKEKKAKAKASRQKRVYRRRQHHKEILDDLDLDDEINILYRSGLKNQQHTLKLSRLMVRAKLLEARSKLLSLLKSGELPCRRLFLDYHGLRLLHGWMEDTPDADLNKDLTFRKAILEVLEALPITNKTILKDSKVLSTVQKWAQENNPSPNSISPNDESSGSGTVTPQEHPVEEPKPTSFQSEMFKSIPDLIKQSEELMKSIGVDELKHIIDSYGQIREHVQKEKEEKIKAKREEAKTGVNEPEKSLKEDSKEHKDSPKLEPDSVSQESITLETATKSSEQEQEKPLEAEQKVEISKVEPNKDLKEIEVPVDTVDDETRQLKLSIYELAKKLINSWKDLKEVFRIPKKERIEQMKVHEREADLRYQALKLDDGHRNSDRYGSRYRDNYRERPSYDSRDSHKEPRQKQSQLSKHQRRHLFEMRVAQQEAEKRNQEMWYCHEQNCLKFGLNPRHVNPNDVPAMMNPITGQYFTIDRRPVQTPPSHVS